MALNKMASANASTALAVLKYASIQVLEYLNPSLQNTTQSQL